jgi:hypothetical protein
MAGSSWLHQRSLLRNSRPQVITGTYAQIVLFRNIAAVPIRSGEAFTIQPEIQVRLTWCCIQVEHTLLAHVVDSPPCCTPYDLCCIQTRAYATPVYGR